MHNVLSIKTLSERSFGGVDPMEVNQTLNCTIQMVKFTNRGVESLRKGILSVGIDVTFRMFLYPKSQLQSRIDQV